MKKNEKRNLSGFFAAFAAAVCVCVLSLVSCQSGEDLDALSTPSGVIIQTEDFLGYSVARLTNEGGQYHTEVLLQQKETKVIVSEEQFQKATLVEATNPITVDVSVPDSIGTRTTSSDTWSDGQVTTKMWESLRATLATYWYEITSISRVNVEFTLVEEGVAEVNPTYAVTYRRQGDDNPDGGTFYLHPRYYQIVEGTVFEDDWKVVDNDGFSTGTLITTNPDISAEIRIGLKELEIEVPEANLGKETLNSESEPTLVSLSDDVNTGTRVTKGFTFSNGQSSTAVYEWLYKTATSYHYEITNVKYIDYVAAPTEDGRMLITQHYQATWSGNGESGTLDLYPRYYQRAAATTYIYDVSEVVKDNSNNGKTRTTTFTIVKKNEQTGEVVDTWTKRVRNALVGEISGLQLFVANTNVADRRFTDFWETTPDVSGIEVDGNWTMTKTCHTYHFKTDFATQAGGFVGPDSEIRFISTDVEFTDPETGWHYEKKLTKDTTVAVDEVQQKNKANTTREGRTAVYNGTYVLKIVNTLNGEEFHSSTAESDLFIIE